MQWRGKSNGFLPKQLSMVSLHSIYHKQLSETACMAEVSELSKEKGRQSRLICTEYVTHFYKMTTCL